MRAHTTRASLLIAAAVAWKLAACSPGSGNGGIGSNTGNSGSGSATGSTGGFGNQGTGSIPGSGSIGNLSAGGDSFPTFNTGGDTGGGGKDGGCPEITQKPEQIIVYKDATVTDTIITYSPIALYIMLDRSGSMVTGFPEGSAQSWSNSTQAINGFLSDPASQNMDVGLAFFPTAPDNGWTCSDGTGSGSNCGTPIVEIAPAPQSGPQIQAAMTASANQPAPLNYTPTECGLIGMISHCEDWTKKTGEQCVGILVTDGNPTLCNAGQNQLVPTPPAQSDIDNLAKIVSDGKSNGVITYVLGLPGSNASVLDPIAQAGGTNASIDVSGGVQAFIAALNSIRSKVATQSTQHISIPTTISTPLPCQWKIPAVTGPNQVFNKDQVNVKFTPQGGTGQDFGYVSSEAQCAGVQNGWYYDDDNAPTQVILCSSTCDMVKGSQGAEVDLAFGCARKPAIPK